jgi:flagellar biosynthetic protein FliQ
MTTDFVIYICRETLLTGIYILLPILGVTLVVGLTIGIFQAVTQIHEMTLTFVPKIALVGFVIFLLLPWFLELLMGFTSEIFNLTVTMAK